LSWVQVAESGFSWFANFSSNAFFFAASNLSSMATDRLKDLKRGVQIDASTTNPFHDDIPSVGSGAATPGPSNPMVQFFSDVELVKNAVNTIREATAQLATITQNAVLATSSEREAELSREMSPLVQSANKKASFAKQMLQHLKLDTERMKSTSSPDVKPSDLRIRENLLNTLMRRFVDVMKDYQNEQTNYKSEIVKKVRRQVQIVKPDATEDEITAVMRSEGGSDQLFQDLILKGDAAESIQAMYDHVQVRYNEVQEIEKSVLELHQIFVDFAFLTEQQGEMLDQISLHVSNTVEYIESANKEYTIAVDYLQSLRRKQCYCCIFLIVVLTIVIGVAVGMSEKQKDAAPPPPSPAPAPTGLRVR